MYSIDREEEFEFDIHKYLSNKMANDGVNISTEKIDEHIEKYSLQEDSARELITKKYGIINPRSSVQVADYLKRSGDADIYDVCYSYREGKYLTNKEKMTELSERGLEIGGDMLRFRKASSMVSNLKSVLKDTKENKINPSVSMQLTNRISYKAPALMNIPKEVLWDVVVPKKGLSIYSIDIKNQEPSIVIQMLGIQSLMSSLEGQEGVYEEIYNKVYSNRAKLYIAVSDRAETREMTLEEIRKMDKGAFNEVTEIDGVDSNGNTVVSIIPSVCTLKIGDRIKEGDIGVRDLQGNVIPVKWDNKLYQMGDKKEVGVVYGDLDGVKVYPPSKGVRSDFKVAWNALTYGGFRGTIANLNIDSDRLFDFFSSIEEMKEYKKMATSKAKSGEAAISAFGTKIDIPKFGSTGRLKRQYLDVPIQATGSDILARLVNHFEEVKEELGWSSANILFTRHDEIIVEVDEEEVGGEQLTKELLEDTFEHEVSGWKHPFRVKIDKVSK